MYVCYVLDIKRVIFEYIFFKVTMFDCMLEAIFVLCNQIEHGYIAHGLNFLLHFL